MAEHPLLFPLQTSEEKLILYSTELGDVSFAKLSSAPASAPPTDSPSWHQQHLAHVLHTISDGRVLTPHKDGGFVAPGSLQLPLAATLASLAHHIPDCATTLCRDCHSHHPATCPRGCPWDPQPCPWPAGRGNAHRCRSPGYKNILPFGTRRSCWQRRRLPWESTMPAGQSRRVQQYLVVLAVTWGASFFPSPAQALQR